MPSLNNIDINVTSTANNSGLDSASNSIRHLDETAKSNKVGEHLQRSFQTAKQSSEQLGTSFVGLTGSMMLGNLAANVVTTGFNFVKDGIGGAITTAGDFQAGLTQLVTGAGESETNLKAVGEGVKNIAVQTGTTFEQLNKGMYMIESAGFHGAEGLNVLKAAAEGAKADGADLMVVGDALTTILHNYKLPASDATAVTNQMITAVASGKMHMQDFASSLSTVLPAANEVGLSFAQIAGAEATLTAGGVTANQATQDLNAVIRSLQAPNQQQIAAMQQMGLNALDLSKNLGKSGLTGTLGEISEAIVKHMGPDGLVLQNALQDSKTAAKAAQQEIEALPPSLQKLAQGFLDGSVNTKEWHKELHTLPPIQAHLMTQFAATADKTNSFNKELRNGSESSKTFYGELYKMLGQTDAANAAFMLTGKNAGVFSENVNQIADAAKGAGGDVKHWDMIQETFNQKLAVFKERLQVVAESLGSALIPMIGGAAEWLGKMYEKVSAYLTPSLTGLFDTISTKVVPVLGKLWHEYMEPIIKVVGETFVGALKLTIDTIKILLDWLAPLGQWMVDNKPIVEGIATAIGVLWATMKAKAAIDAFIFNFNLARDGALAAIAAIKGGEGLAGLNSSLIGFPGWGIFAAAALGAFAAVMASAKSLQDQMDKTLDSIQGASRANDEYSKQAHDQFKAGTITKEQYQKRLQYAADNAKGDAQAAGSFPQFASGVQNFGGGLAYVHQGEVLTNLPRGTNVIPKREVDAAIGGVTLNIYGNIDMSSNQKIDDVAARFGRQLNAARAGSF